MMNQQLQVASSNNRPKGIIATMAQRFAMDPSRFEQTLRKTVMPASATPEEFVAFLITAQTYDLNPVTAEIYAFPKKHGGISVVVGVDGWVKIAQSRKELDGLEFDYHETENGELEAVTAVIYRKDRSKPTKVTEFMRECRRDTNQWRSHPRRMLRHKALIQGLRYSFGLGGLHDEDEAEIIAAGEAYVVRDNEPARASDGLMQRASEVEVETQHHESAGASDDSQDQPKPEWPQALEDGTLIDSRGVPWIEKVHSGAKSCNDDGTWRKRRGVWDEDMRQAEAQWLEQDQQDQQDPQDQQDG
jgi:phage recombination protein Bet